MRPTSEVLLQTIELIKQGWDPVCSRNELGKIVDPRSPDALSWNIEGAIQRVVHVGREFAVEIGEYNKATYAMRTLIGNIGRWSIDRTQAEAIKILEIVYKHQATGEPLPTWSMWKE